MFLFSPGSIHAMMVQIRDFSNFGNLSKLLMLISGDRISVV